MVSEEVGIKIRNLRIMRGLTQEELAELLYRKKNTISQYENGKINIRVDDLGQIADALHTNIGYFFDDTKETDLVAEEMKGIISKLQDPRFKQEAVDILKVVGKTALLFLPAGSV